MYTPVRESTTRAVIRVLEGSVSVTLKLPPAEACSALPYVSFARMENSVSRPATARDRPLPKASECEERAGAGRVCMAKGEPEMWRPDSVTAM